MYLQAWRKYLPVILILLKRSAESAQTLAMDAADFVKSSGGKKLKLGFTGLELNKGRLPANSAQPEVAKDLVLLLNETPSVKNLLLTRRLNFSMTNDCCLSITDVTVETPAAVAAE